MDELINQVSGLLADVREFTPELVVRLQPVMEALAQFRIGLFTALSIGFGSVFAAPVSLILALVLLRLTFVGGVFAKGSFNTHHPPLERVA